MFVVCLLCLVVYLRYGGGFFGCFDGLVVGDLAFCDFALLCLVFVDLFVVWFVD